MRRKKPNKTLLVSLLILIVLCCIYYREPLGVFLGKCSSFCAQKYEEIKTEHEQKKQEKEAAKELERALKEAELEVLQKQLAEYENKSEIVDSETLVENHTFSDEELALIRQQNLVVIRGADKNRYITITGLDGSMKYLKLPSLVDQVSFREMDDNVYAIGSVVLYNEPSLVNGIVITEPWQQYKRVGISEDCCYQLVTDTGEILYAKGIYFRRYREDMETTETITLPDETVLLDVKHISQYSSLPNGCEITSLATVMNYLGFDVTKETLSDDYLPKAAAGEANFYEEFVGDPRSENAYGCYAGAIVNAANAYLASHGSEIKAVNYTGSDFQSLLEKVKSGNPVIVWTTAHINEDPGYTTEWYVDGEYIVWKANLHCVVLIGYDTKKNTVTVSDPMRGIEEFDMTKFIKRYKQFYSQAVILE